MRRLAAVLGRNDEPGFILRFTLVALVLLIVPWAVSTVVPAGPRSLLVPGSAAVILAAVYTRRGAEALLALGLFVLFYDTIALRMGGTIRQLDEVAVGLLSIIALARAARHWRDWMWLPRDLSLLGALAMGIISSLAAGVPGGIWVPALILVGKPIAFLYTAMWTSFRLWEIRAAMKVALTVGIVVLALSVIELFNPAAFQEAFGLNEYLRARGPLPVVKSLFVHPALYGWFTAFIALFLSAQFLVTRRWIWLLLAVAFAMGPFLSARRRAILALITGLGAAFVASLHWLRSPAALARSWVPLAAGMTLVLALFSPGIVGLYERTIDRYLPDMVDAEPSVDPDDPSAPTIEDDDENPRARTALYSGSFEIGQDYFPLGAGLGRYASWMSRVNYSPLYHEYGLSAIRGLRPDSPQYITDTFWPQILGELGAAGLVAYLVFLGSLGVMLWLETRRADGPVLRLLTLGAGMVFAQAMVESLASSMFHSAPRVYLLYLAIGAVASLAWRRRADARRAIRAPG